MIKYFLGAVLGAVNTYNNAKKIKKKDVKAELKGLAKKGIQEIGKQAAVTNPVSSFIVGSAVVAAGTIANAKGTSDNQNRADSRVISNPTFDSNLYFTAEEAYQLITNDDTAKDKVASIIYYKDIGSRRDLTVAESDVEFAGSTETTKSVYRAKTVTNIRKLVTEGYVRINRTSLDVNIQTEKASL